MSKQDKQLRNSIIACFYDSETEDDTLPMDAAIDNLEALLTTAQIQLVSELEAHRQKMHPCDESYECFDAVPVSVLQHKKQELERLQ